MLCRYCGDQIEDQVYTYMPFKNDEDYPILKPVHMWHLNGTRNMDKTIPYKAPEKEEGGNNETTTESN